eukprot:CAMPEP_0201929716 /NCGR_PEP_ID=MMETSP0903-20130614/23588_1 /ASSEMBLY_ACC=CAM_ASM_000552 /TAXON_ID=420261 /ORGANISM="Thalassiosira antarctica, Strain CCMP982" /LENGTH=376 /DNA_ID=CAMNT_0048468569 /DNA_START=67 /DNA_END=1194 /DNA_ORIENTATION=-
MTMTMRYRAATSLSPKRNKMFSHDDVDKPEDSFDVSTRKSRKQLRRIVVTLLTFGLAATVGWTILMSLNQVPVNETTPPSGLALDDTSPPGNPTLISQNMSELWFHSAANGMRFELPTDINWIRNFKGIAGSRLDSPFYMRDLKEIEERGNQGSCTGVLDVLGWLMGEVNGNDGCLMVAYGELIHIHREKDFVDSTGNFFDDDIDTWASLDTMAHIARLEPELFRRFGWTIRPIVTDPEIVRPFGWPIRAAVTRGGYVVLAQMMSVCGLTVTETTGKINSTEPAIDFYPLVTIPDEENKRSVIKDLLQLIQIKKATANQEKIRNTVKDLWQGNQFSESLFFPRKNLTFISAGTPRTLQLQLPNQPIRLMECLYGNW